MEAEERFLPEGHSGAASDTHGPSVRHEVRTCRIARWRGYVTSRFYAVTDEGELLESKPFRWRRAAPPPESKKARAAHDELVARLEADGWARFEGGRLWYATTLTRTVAVPVSGQTAVQTTPVPAPPVVAAPQKVVQEEVVEEPEPGARPPHVAEAAAESPPPTRRRWRRRTGMLSIAVAAIAGITSALLLGVGHAAGGGTGNQPAASGRATHRAPAAKKPSAPAVVQAPTQAAPGPAVTARLADVRIVAHGTGSWVEARRGSKTGPVLYRGVLTTGKRLHLRAPRVWAQFGAAGNLSITADGKLLALRGTFDKLFRPRTG
ncbi:MAG: hypothetical protein ACRDL2_13090 [Gaiellaceae bacterium]